jgi:hypothetical protein
MLRGAGSKLGAGIRVWTVVHYAVCALAITIGLYGLLLSGLHVVFGVELGRSVAWTIVYWVTIGSIFICELLYRPSGTLTAGLGFFALLALCGWFAANILVSATL